MLFNLRFVPMLLKCFVQSGADAVASHVIEPRDVMSGLSFAEKRSVCTGVGSLLW